MVVEARQSFQFFRQKPSFLEIVEVYINLGIGFDITWLVLTNYKKLVRRNQFQINHASHLKLVDFKQESFEKPKAKVDISQSYWFSLSASYNWSW